LTTSGKPDQADMTLFQLAEFKATVVAEATFRESMVSEQSATGKKRSLKTQDLDGVEEVNLIFNTIYYKFIKLFQ